MTSPLLAPDRFAPYVHTGDESRSCELMRVRYNVIYADPPWKYSNWHDKAHGAAKAHYTEMSFEDLASLPISRYCDPDWCVLFLWATWPKLDAAIDVMRAWGFEFKTGFPWVKTVADGSKIRRGIGFWTQSTSEMLLIGVRGARPPLDHDKHGRQYGLLTGEARTFYGTVEGHSKKPPTVREWITDLFPGAARLELFATERAPGWTSIGLVLGTRLGRDGITTCAPIDHGSHQP